MPVIENQQTSLIHLISINDIEITEHNRTLQTSIELSSSSVELSNGTTKKYSKKSKNIFSISFTYLPNTSDATVDGREGRDFLKTISQTRGVVNLKIKLDPSDSVKSYTCFVNSYSESLIRRDIPNSRSFYNVTIELGEQ